MEEESDGRMHVVAFDLHHVLARPLYKDMVVVFFRFLTLKELSFLFLFSLNPHIWYMTIKYLVFEKYVPEKYMDLLIATYPSLARHTRMPELLMHLCNCQAPHLDTWRVVKELKDAGHVMCLASNISTHYLASLRAQWAEERRRGKRGLQCLPHLNHQGDHSSVETSSLLGMASGVSDMADGLPTDLFSLLHHTFTSDGQDAFARKPTREYFERFLTFVRDMEVGIGGGSAVRAEEEEERGEGEMARSVVFVDDNPNNVAACEKFGAGHVSAAVRYTTTPKLRASLAALRLF